MSERKASLPVVPKLHHIALKTNQFNEMCNFYRSLLNFRPTLEVDQAMAFYTFDLVHHRLVILNDPSLSHGPNTAFYYYDPDKNIIELEIDNFGPDLEKGLEFMSEINCDPTILFSKPEVMFMPINPETYLKAWKAGATQAELHKRSYSGEFVEGSQNQPLPPGFAPK
jgi:hypothetical protein